MVQKALEDDFDTPKAIRAVTSLVALGNKMLHSSPVNRIITNNICARDYIEFDLGNSLIISFTGKRKIAKSSGHSGTRELHNVDVDFFRYENKHEATSKQRGNSGCYR